MSDNTQLERDSRIRTTALVILTFIAVAVALFFLRPVLMPFVLALFIASGLAPVLNAVQGYLESSRPVAIAVTAVLSVVATLVLWSVIAVSVTELRSKSVEYNNGFKLMLARASSWLEFAYPAKPEVDANDTGDNPPVVAEAVPLEPGDELIDGEARLLPDEPMPDIDARIQPIYEFVAARMNRILLLVGNELVTVLSSGLLVMIFLFFLLLGGSDVKLPEDNIYREIDGHVRQYIISKTVISAFTGLAFGIVLWLFGVPLAFVLGILAFLLNFIPNLGPIIASLLPVPLVWMLVEATQAQANAVDAAQATGATLPDDGLPDFGITKAVIVITLASLVQFLSGNVVEPKIMGDQFRLHPIAILLSLMFWYMIWGLVGAFLAVPITSALKVVFAELESTRPAADLLEGNLSILAKREPAANAARA